MYNTGIHHVSVLSSNAKEAYYFYHHILGMKLAIKTVNQDEPTMYHLFFGDETGRAGTEFTVFEMKGTPQTVFGTNAIERVMFLVSSEDALHYWENRLTQFDVLHYGIEIYNDRKILRFEDSDGQRLGFTYREEPVKQMNPYVANDIPAEHAILGIGDVHMRVRYPEATQKILEQQFGFDVYRQIVWNNFNVHLLRFADNDFKHEVHLIEDKKAPIQRLGVGGVHHVAFGVQSYQDLLELQDWLDQYNHFNSGIINREFIVSSYFREPNSSLFEVATPLAESYSDYPNQALAFDDIPLFLPDFLESRREEIERDVSIYFD